MDIKELRNLARMRWKAGYPDEGIEYCKKALALASGLPEVTAKIQVNDYG